MIKNFLNNEPTKRKQIVITPNGTISPVVRADKSVKNTQSSGTYQKAEAGDFIVVTIFELTGETCLKIYQATETHCVAPPKGCNLLGVIQALTPAVMNWLTSDDDNQFLPVGVGWDGIYSASDLVKIDLVSKRFPSNLPKDLSDRLIRAAYFTPNASLYSPPEVIAPALTPTITVKESEWDVMVVVDTNDVVHVTHLEHNVSISTVSGVSQIVLVRFKPLKVKGNEQLELKTYNVVNNSEV